MTDRWANLHIVSWNRWPMTNLVIKTINRNTRPYTFSTIVLDNGSMDPGRQRLIKMAQDGEIYWVYPQYKNYGLEWARQYLLTRSKAEYFVCVDNDCLPPPIGEDGTDWLSKLIGLMEKYPEYAAISCRTQVMVGTGNIFEEADKNGDDLLDFPHPGGSLRLMRRSAVTEVGGWDRKSSGRGSEERLICGKLRDAGYKTGFAVNIRCLHLFGLRGQDNGTDRWGYDRDMRPEDSGHSDIWHPALANGDDFDEVVRYAGIKLADAYFNH